MLAETGHGAALQAQVSEDKSLQSGLSSDTLAAGDEVTVAKDALRKMNAPPSRVGQGDGPAHGGHLRPPILYLPPRPPVHPVPRLLPPTAALWGWARRRGSGSGRIRSHALIIWAVRLDHRPYFVTACSMAGPAILMVACSSPGRPRCLPGRRGGPASGLIGKGTARRGSGVPCGDRGRRR